jgi:hypothetical protein
MRTPWMAVAVTAVMLAAATAGGLLIAACGGSSRSASDTAQAAEGAPGQASHAGATPPSGGQQGPMPGPSQLFGSTQST